MTQKLIIDADPGIGDAVAIAMAVFDPEFDVLAVTGTAGAVSGQSATRNVQAIIEFIDPPKWPRLGTAESEVGYVRGGPNADLMLPELLNGELGLGDFRFNVAELHHPHNSTRLMIDIVRTHPGEVTLLTLGPLTNVELALERAPDFLEMVNRVVCLGGAGGCGGDVTAAAEFNIYANPTAARNVLCSAATKTLIPLDISQQLVLTLNQFDRMQADDGSPLGRLLGELLPFAFRAYHEHLGLEGVRLNEVAALASISQPRLFECEPGVVDVEVQGELTRGATVFDRRGVDQWQTNIEIATDIDAQGVIDYLIRTVRGAA